MLKFVFVAVISVPLTLMLSLASTTVAQENGELGRLWTFENPPLAYFEREYGFKPDQEWLNSLQLGALRIDSQSLDGENIFAGFGSASFASPQGLIITSNRCVRYAVARTRPTDLELLKTGFVAASFGQEIRLQSSHDKWLTASQLIKFTNVSEEVNKGLAQIDNETQTRKQREANQRAILNAAKKADPNLVPQIVSLDHGRIFQLHQYRVYNDIRLVCIPHLQTAHFGGDQGNFTYPCHSIDFAFLRAYQDGKPAGTTKHYFKWKPGGAKKDELIFVAGYPGETKRLLTTAQLEFERDIRIPIEIERLENALRISKDPRSNTYSGEFDPENPSEYYATVRTGILGLENSLKAARGNLHGLTDAKLMAQKTAAEQAFKRRVMADKRLAAKYHDLWDRISRMVEQRRRHEAQALFQTPGGGLLEVAVAIVRMCDPDESEERRTQSRKTFERWAGGTINFNFHGDAHVLDHFVRARSWLPKDDPFFTKVLGGRSPEKFIESMTPLKYDGLRESLAKSGWKGVKESDEPAIVAARELVILMRKHEKLGEELDAKEEALNAEIARALFACYGNNFSLDATMTLRFTDGVVRGYSKKGKLLPYRTTINELFARNAEFDNEYPFNLPKIWLDRKDKIDLTTSVNFVSTNDIALGNTGSVVVNENLEVVGIVVDGNSVSLHNDFVFTDNVPGAVSVHVDGIMESLSKIYDANRIVDELTGK